jgi:predicted nucleic acid-binding protein
VGQTHDLTLLTVLSGNVHFLWRPQLRDPKDELVQDAVVNASADFLVTHNVRDFAASKRFAVQLVTPGQFLKQRDGGTYAHT